MKRDRWKEHERVDPLVVHWVVDGNGGAGLRSIAKLKLATEPRSGVVPV